jgi:hypothetical protein
MTDGLKSDTVHIGRTDNRGLHVRRSLFYFVKGVLNGFVRVHIMNANTQCETRFFEPCVVIYLRNKNIQNAHFLH